MSIAMTESNLLEAKRVGEKIREEIRRDVAAIQESDGVRLKLACVMVGHDPAAESYLRSQEKTASALGIAFQSVLLEDAVSQAFFLEWIERLGRQDSGVHGIMVELPLPSHLAAGKIYSQLNPQKDVEGVHPATLGFLVMRKAKLVPATALACLTLIDSVGLDCRGKEAVIVGQSAIVGRPLQLLLGERRATTVVCNTGTPVAHLAQFIGRADLVIACAGKPGLIRGEWIRKGACVIDVGTTVVNGKIVGDVEFETARKRAGWITPVPGGVGPLTVLMLMKNLVQAYRWQKEDPDDA